MLIYWRVVYSFSVVAIRKGNFRILNGGAFHFSPEYINMRVATAEIFWLTIIEANV